MSKKLNKKNPLIIILLIAAFIFLITFIVYITGGTRFSYLHLMYLPIILAAYYYRVKGGVASAILGGLLLGPFMPINTSTMAMQSIENWSFRMFFLILVGIFSGSLFSSLDSQLQKINKIAYYDSDTSLPNKTKLNNDLEDRISSGSSSTKFHFIILSINNFIDIYKLIGFTNFSDYINKLLVYIKKFADFEEIYYITENKYGIIIGEKEVEDFNEFLNDFISYLEQPLDFNSISIFNDITLGITSYPEQSKIADELMDQAFIALEKANQKKSQYWIYNKNQTDFKNDNINLLADINQSIKNNDFCLYYQPKINLKKNKVETFEALIRWNHPRRGHISPAEFIPLVEKSSLIEGLTDWVINSSLEDIKKFNDSEFKSVKYNIAVNIAARNLQNPDFAESLISKLESRQIEPQYLSLEITETDLILDIEKNIQKLQKLKNKGIQIYLDDFGKGYSSLRYLKELPVDYLKIDRYFIKNISEKNSAQDIIHSIIEMAHSLDLKVVAEGIETKEQLEFLKRLDCDYAQGYYFARPAKKEKIIRWLQQREKSNLKAQKFQN